MTRLALILSAAVLGTGCIVVDDDRTCARSVTVDWSFQLADGSVTASCSTAGVAFIDVYANGFRVGSFDCFGPPGTVALAQGTNALVVEGVDAGGAIRYRELSTIDASTCGNQGTILTRPAQGLLVVDYSFFPVNACFATQPTFMWLAVQDDLAGQPAFADTGTTSFQLCSTTAAAPRYALPVGPFTLVGIEEVLPTGGGVTTVGSDCTDRPFEITATLETTVQPVLVSSSARCF